MIDYFNLGLAVGYVLIAFFFLFSAIKIIALFIKRKRNKKVDEDNSVSIINEICFDPIVEVPHA